MNPAVIDVQRLSRRFGDLVAVDGVSFQVHAANMAKAASRFSSFLEKQTVSRLSRFRNRRWVPFGRSTSAVHIVHRSFCRMFRWAVRWVPTISEGV
jgi:hypothetical protein